MTITQLQATVGPDTNNPATDTSRAVRRSPEGGLYSSQITARYQAAVQRGNVYGVANQTGVTSAAGLSVTTPVLTLANPIDSGVNAVLWYASALFSVVWPAVAEVWLAVGTDTTDDAVTGTLTTTHRNMLLGSGRNPNCSPFLAATLPATPVGLSLLGIGLEGPTNLMQGAPVMDRWFDGGVILKPGTNISIQCGTISGASGMVCEYIWEEFEV